MNNEKKIEELQSVCSTLLGALNAISVDLKVLYVFEDMIYNNHFDLAVDVLKSNEFSMSNEDKDALIFVFENASREYKLLLK